MSRLLSGHKDNRPYFKYEEEVTDEKVDKIYNAVKHLGWCLQTACSWQKIAKSQFYRYIGGKEKFLNELRKVKHYARI